MKKNIIYTAIMMLALGTAVSANAQQALERNDLIYHAIRMPQSNQLNPSFFPIETTCYVTLPKFNLGFGMPFSIKDLDIQKVGDRYKLSANHLATLIEQDNSIHASLSTDLLGFGFRVNNLFFNFNTSIEMSSTVNLPEEVFTFMKNGNSGHIGVGNEAVADISDLMRLITYAKIQVGGGFIFPVIPLTVGAHINILDGIYHAATTDGDITLYTSDDYATIRTQLDYTIKSSGMLDVKTNIDGKDKKASVKTAGMPTNLGFTFDLGAKYKLNDFIFSASLLDFGPGIHWKQNVQYLTPKNPNQTITFNGLDLEQFLQGGQMDDDFIKKYGDTLQAMIKSTQTQGADYWYTVPTKINLGASYTYKNLVRAGLLFHGEWEKGLMCAGKGWNARKEDFRFNTTASVSVNVFNWLELMVANSFVFSGPKKDLLNPGFGINFAPAGAVQLYLMCDYMSDIYLVKDKDVNFFFGMNIMIGKGPQHEL